MKPFKRRVRLFQTLKSRMGKASKEEILEGNIVPTLFKLGWPVMISSLLQTMYNLIDTFWIGRLPKEEAELSVAAIGLSWPYVFLMISVGLGFGVAGLAMVSQHIGAKRIKEANEDVGQFYLIIFIFSLVFSVIGYLTSPLFLELLTGGSPAVPYGIDYLRIIFLGIPFMMITVAFTFILNGYGDTITPMLLMVVSIVINVILDPFLIFGWYSFPAMGIAGAALATVIARFIGSLIALYMLFRGIDDLKLKLKYMKPNGKKIRKFFKIGLPASFSRIADSTGFIILVGLIAALPSAENALAAYTIGNRIINIVFLILGGLGVAISTMIGQSLGADKIDRAVEVTKKGISLMVILMVIVSIFQFLLRDVLISIFIPDSKEVIRIGADFLAILAVGGPFFALFSGIAAVFDGSGHTTQQMALSLTRLWLLRIPLVYLLAFYFGWNYLGAWWGMVFSNIIGAIFAFGLFKKGLWKEKIIETSTVDKM
ncbi:MAG: MATE family efflux transporter [Thermoplasmatota archaeon]